MANKCYDLFGLVSVMPGGNPFEKRGDFHRVFANPFNLFSDPIPARINRLFNYLMGFTVRTPSSILRIPGLTARSYGFVLETRDMLMVLYYTKLFAETPREAKRDSSDVHGILPNSRNMKSLVHATRAQQWAAHSALIPDPFKNDEEDRKKIQRRMQSYPKEFEKTPPPGEIMPIGAERSRKLRDFIRGSPPTGRVNETAVADRR